MTTSVPTPEQLATLPLVAQHVVGPEHLDLNGHMNVAHYFAFAGYAIGGRERLLGVDEAYREQRRMSTFVAEQHIRYLAECVEGDRIDVHVPVIGRSDKAVHMAGILVNRTSRQLSCVVEAVMVHIDFGTRRPVSFPEDLAATLDAAVEADRRTWDLPLSGSLGVRAPA